MMKLPDSYPDDMKKAFLKWQKLGPNKAFTMGPNGTWGYSVGRKTLKVAKDAALDNCRDGRCVIIATDGTDPVATK